MTSDDNEVPAQISKIARLSYTENPRMYFKGITAHTMNVKFHTLQQTTIN